MADNWTQNEHAHRLLQNKSLV